MSATSLSDHIPDLNLITYYAEKRQSFFSRISPWTKFALLILIVLLVTLTRDILILGVLYCIVLGAYAGARLPVRKLFAWYTLPVIFVLSLAGIMAWTEPGNAVISFSVAGMPFVLTDNGIMLLVILLLKALIVVTYSLFFLMTTRYQHFSAMIYRIFPYPIDQIFLMAYRFLFLTLAMTSSILKAVRSRGGGLIHSLRVQGRLFAEIFALVFIRSFERSERVHKAMISRGFSESYSTAVEVPALRLSEYLLVGIRYCSCPRCGVHDIVSGRVKKTMTIIRHNPAGDLHCPHIDKTRELIHVDCASHVYPDGSVGIHDMCFYVQKNEIVALCGPNGSGKSTLIEHLNGLLMPSRGNIAVNGKSITMGEHTDLWREVGVVFQRSDDQLFAPTGT